MSNTVRKRSEPYTPYHTAYTPEEIKRQERREKRWQSDAATEQHKPNQAFRRLKHKKRRQKQRRELQMEIRTDIPGNYPPYNGKDNEIWDWW